MPIDNNLTVLLIIKDRQPFTLRWMKYANDTLLPFKVLIADGGKDPVITQKLSNSNTFPNIEYEYIRYPYDQSYREYFDKISDVISKVKTPYLVLADDDDFFLSKALHSCINFLNKSPGYVSCGGRIATFSIHPALNATYGKGVEFILHPPANSMDDATSLERVEKHFQSYTYNITWYDVHRTEVIGPIYNDLSVFSPDDILLAEMFGTYLTVARGKVKRVPDLMLLRQINIINSSCTHDFTTNGDFFDRMLLPTWSRDFNGFIDAVTKAVVQEDGLAGESVRNKLIKGYRQHSAPNIVRCLADETGLSNNTVFSRIQKIVSGWNDENAVKQILRQSYHKFQDTISNEPRPRPITRSSKFYKDVQPVSDFLISTGTNLKK